MSRTDEVIDAQQSAVDKVSLLDLAAALAGSLPLWAAGPAGNPGVEVRRGER
jgi:hypothetical protein